MPEDEPVEVPVTGELDLHPFDPKDVKEVVEEYIRLCREKGILEIRIVHGKGTGALRETIHALLRRHEGVVAFQLGATAAGGSWGATWVKLAPQRPARNH
jgi:DNA-nicking Smr family endonuclease